MYYEHLLKQSYTQFLNILSAASMEDVAKHKLLSIRIVSELAAECPEQRLKAINIITNKLGDVSGSVASKAEYYLTKMFESYPATSSDIIESIRSVLLRPNISVNATRHCLAVLNYIRYERGHSKEAHEMLSLLLTYFTLLYEKKDADIHSLQIITIGLRRCIPYCDDFSGVKEHLDELYKLSRNAPMTRAIDCIVLLQRLNKHLVSLDYYMKDLMMF
ncbi:CCAAT/enhancer-binding protein zeta [Entamoeba marina]